MKLVAVLFISLFFLTGKVTAQPGQCLNFDGSNDFVDPNTLVTTVSNNFTYELWARPTATHGIDLESNSTTNISGISGQRYAIWPTWRNTNAGVGVSVGTNGVSVYEHGSNYLTSILTWTGTLNNWTHIAVVVSNKLSSLYINGVFVKSGASTFMQNLYPSLGECAQYGPLVGGIGGGTYGYFAGDIDEVRIWSTVRTQAQIAANMNTELGCTANLLAYYKFNNGIASANNIGTNVAADSGGNNYNASLINFGLNGSLSNWIAPGAVSSISPGSLSTTQSTLLCMGSAISLTASGATSYTWNTGSNSNSILVQPTVTTSYSVSATLTTNCTSNAIITVSVPAQINAVNLSGTICSGQVALLNVNGAASYTWVNSNSNSNQISVTPSVSTIYTVNSQVFSGCLYTATVSVPVVQNLTVTPSSTFLCSGQSVTLQASGGLSYNWPSLSSLSSSVVVQPTTSTIYLLQSPVNVGCTLYALATVSVAPQVSFSQNTVICQGATITLSATGAQTYTWSNNVTQNSIVVQPSTTTIFTVSAANGVCTSSAAITVSVAPTISATTSDSIICMGQGAVLTAAGGSTYTWTPVTSNASMLFVLPTGNTTYTVSSSPFAGCNYTAVVTVSVASNISITPSSSLLCSPQSVTLQASGGTNYVWTNSGSTASIQIVSPQSNSSYTVQSVINSGCTLTALASITVAGPFSSSSNTTLCLGSTLTLSAAGAQTYSWSNGATQSTCIVQPTLTTTYSIFANSYASCNYSAAITVSVPPSLSITASQSIVCPGQAAILSAAGGNTYTWSTGTSNAAVVAIVPATTTSYSVYSSPLAGCTYSAATTISVASNLSVSPSTTFICSGQSTTLVASGGLNYSWLNQSNNTPSLVVSPSGSTNYTVLSVVNSACTLAVVSTISVASTVSLSSISNTICEGQSTTLTAIGAASPYSWLGSGISGTGSVAIVQPSFNTTYTVSSLVQGCNSSATTAVIVVKKFTATPSFTTICLGEQIALQFSGSAVYSVNPVGTTTGSILVQPAISTTYAVSSQVTNACFFVTNVVVQVNKCVGIEELSNLNEGTVFPNPFSDALKIINHTAQQLSLYDVAGKCLLTKSIDSPTYLLQVADLAAGIYFLKLQNSHEAKTIKVIKQ